MIHRVDHSARRFQRASAFKVYLTNPSMFSALFTPVDADNEITPRLVETAVFAQWLHRPDVMHYARWDAGEIDFVWLDALQRPTAATEVKWSDHAFDSPNELKPLVSFCTKHRVSDVTVTTRTTAGLRTSGKLTINYQPASMHSFVVGQVLVQARNEDLYDSR